MQGYLTLPIDCMIQELSHTWSLQYQQAEKNVPEGQPTDNRDFWTLPATPRCAIPHTARPFLHSGKCICIEERCKGRCTIKLLGSRLDCWAPPMTLLGLRQPPRYVCTLQINRLTPRRRHKRKRKMQQRRLAACLTRSDTSNRVRGVQERCQWGGLDAWWGSQL
jgi:hypothetical protein